MTPSPLKEEKVGVVSAFTEEQHKEVSPKETSHYQEKQSGEQTQFVAEGLGCQQAQTPEVLNGGSHQNEHSPSQKGVCSLMGFLSVQINQSKVCLSVYECVCEFP